MLFYYGFSSVCYFASLMFGACGVFSVLLVWSVFSILYVLLCFFCVDASGVVCVCICIVCVWFVSLFLESDVVGACISIVCLF